MGVDTTSFSSPSIFLKYMLGTRSGLCSSDITMTSLVNNSQGFSLLFMVGKTILVALVVNSYSCSSFCFTGTSLVWYDHRQYESSGEELLCVGISPRGSDLKMKSSFSSHCSKEGVYPMGGETSTSKRRIETMICKQLCCVFENKEFAGI